MLKNMDTKAKHRRRLIFLHQMTTKESRAIYLWTGSAAEMTFEYYQNNPSDLDIMIYPSDIRGIEGTNLSAEPNIGRLFRHTSNLPGCHPGYTKIETPHQSHVINLRNGMGTLIQKDEGPAAKIKESINQEIIEFPIPFVKDLDIVVCIPCGGWPSAASEWKVRHRESGWPSPNLVETVVSGGYHLVEKPHPHHNDDHGVFWRLSFSKAECVLIDSWTPEQMHLYAILRRMKQQINARGSLGAEGRNSVLCTYHIKTAMFWECETQPREFWDTVNISATAREIFCKIISWLIEKNCPNYFIPENNMLDHLPDDLDLSLEIGCLVDFIQSDDFEKYMHMERAKSEVKLWQSKNHLFLETQGFTHERVASRNQEPDKQIFADVLELLYEALWAQRKLRHDPASYKRHSQKLTTKTHVNAEVENMFLRTIRLLFFSPERHFSPQSLLSETIRTIVRHLRPPGEILHGLTNFVCFAYLANYLYAHRKDYESAEILCEAILGDCDYNIVVTAFSELFYPVLLSKSWSPIFDGKLRTTFGFCLLWKRSKNKIRKIEQESTSGGNSTLIKICPMMFLAYLEVRCEVKLGDQRGIRRAVERIVDQMVNKCPSDGHTFSIGLLADELASAVLLAALKVALRRSQNSWASALFPA